MTLPNQDNDLDEKLHDLLYEQAKSYYFEGSEPEWFEKECPALIEKFKQAFADAGYSRSALAGIAAKMQIHGMMTGQEWYERFVKELGTYIEHGPGGDSSGFRANSEAHAAARKAAGLQDD